MPKLNPTPNWGYEETKNKISNTKDAFTKRFCAVAYATGGRLNEIKQLMPSSIQWKNINGETRLIVVMRTLKQAKTINGKVHGKRWAYREIPINPLTEPYYAMTIKETFATENPFTNTPDRTIQDRLRKNLDIHPHDLRHLRPSHLAKQKVPGQKRRPTIQELAKLMGHKKWDMARVYIEEATTEEISGIL